MITGNISVLPVEDKLIIKLIQEDEYYPVAIESDEYEVTTPDFNTVYRKGYSPYINKSTGTWWEFNDNLKKFVDTHIPYQDADTAAAIENIEEEIASLGDVYLKIEADISNDDIDSLF